MRKRLLIGLLSAGMVGAMLPGVAAAGKCLEWPGGRIEGEGECYYVGDTPIDPTTVVDNFTLNGTSGDDTVFEVRPGGTFNGGRGDDSVQVGDMDGTFNGGPGDDYATDVGAYSTFNGGPGNDAASSNVGTFNGGGGDDYVGENWGTFAGGGGSDCYDRNVAGYGTVSSADEGAWTVEDGCTYP